MTPIQFFFEDVDELTLNRASTTKWISQCVEKEGFVLGNVNYILCSDPYLLNINKTYLNHDYNTDIITFNYNENQTINSDIFISLDRVKENAQEFKVSFEAELNRVMIHGILHLLGYNDKSPEEQAVMTSKEDFYLALHTQTK